MQSSSNQFLVGSIQQYANSLYLNQMAANMGMPSQMLPKLRTINKACKHYLKLLYLINSIRKIFIKF